MPGAGGGTARDADVPRASITPASRADLGADTHPPARARASPSSLAAAPRLPQEPDGLFGFISRSVPPPLPTPRASSSPPARTPAGPHLSPQLMLGCSGHPAGLGSGRGGGKEPSWLPEPPHRGRQARAALPSQPGERGSFGLPLKFFSPVEAPADPVSQPGCLRMGGDAGCPVDPRRSPRWGMLSWDGPLCSAAVTHGTAPAASSPGPHLGHLNSALGRRRLSLPPAAEPGRADGSSTGERRRMKPQPRVSREGDGRARNPRPSSCDPRGYCAVAAALPAPHGSRPGPRDFSNSSARTSEPQISSGWQKPAEA